jgi:glycosyltransferase involved in cell wall biosynthesis
VERYVVAVTGEDERKNTHGLLRAWARVDPAVRAGRHLVIVAAHSPGVVQRWSGWADDVGVRDGVIFTGSVSDDEMVGLLQRAELAVMPSTEEGFGLPVLEAAACGTPAICSNVSALPEVLDEPAACFDPFDPGSIAAAIERALVDAAHRRELAEAGRRAAARWTWPGVAERALDGLAELGRRWPQRVRIPESRVAVAGPFGGSASAIGQYDERLLDAVGRRLHEIPNPPSIDVFVDAAASSEPTAPGRRPVRAIGRYTADWNHDHIVAILGDSPSHIATAELALAVRCHVWLHDASLVGVHLGLANGSGNQEWAEQHAREQLRRNEVAATIALIGDDELLDPARYDALGVRLLGETLDNARSVIVSSSQAAGIVADLRPQHAPLLVLPLAHPPIVPPAHVPEPGAVLAVGWLTDNKSPDLALDVLARLDERATLTFIGPSLGDTAERVRGLAEAAGLGERVRITGRLDDDAYAARVARGRVGLQLRTAHRGEMSAAIADLVAHGIPTVTTLATAGPSSPGLTVVDRDADRIARAIAPLLVDDDAWRVASADALHRASQWTFDDVASALLDWIEDADGLPAGTVRYAVRAFEEYR